MASTPGEEEFLTVIQKSQEAVIAVVRQLAEAVRTASPKLPQVSMPFADKLPGPQGAVASAHDFTEELLKAKPEGAVASTYDFAEHLLASQRKFSEDLLTAAAPLMPGRATSTAATETYKPGQVVP